MGLCSTEIISSPSGFAVRRDGRIIAVGIKTETAAKAHAKRCDYSLDRWSWERVREPLLGEAGSWIIARRKSSR